MYKFDGEINRKANEECDNVIEEIVDDLKSKECERMELGSKQITEQDINNTLERIEKEHGKEHAQVVGAIFSNYHMHNRGIDLEEVITKAIVERAKEEQRDKVKENESR